MDDFSRLVVSGVNIEIFKNNEYVIKLDAFENTIENITFNKNDSTLTITPTENKVIMGVANVKIGMPVLKSLHRTGTGAVSIAGFEQPLLELELSGTGKLRAKDNTFQQLNLKTSGTVNVDMQTSEVKNAEIFAKGVNQIVLNLSHAKSTLSGEISGVSTLAYCGEPINSLLVQGISKTRKIQCL